MNLKEQLSLIKQYSKTIVNNFMTIGNLLKEIREKEIYKDKYDTFSEFLTKEELPFSRPTGVRMIALVEDKQLCSLSNKVGITKVLEIIYVKDQDTRDELIQMAEEGATKQEIREERVKRKVGTVGEAPKHLDKLDEIHQNDEYNAKIRRDFDYLIKQIGIYQAERKKVADFASNLRSAFKNFVAAVRIKYPNHSLIDEAKKLMRELE